MSQIRCLKNAGRILTIFLAWPCAALSCGAVSFQSGTAQLGNAVHYHALKETPGTYHLVQQTRDNTLVLTPNEGFFPRLGLTAAGEGSVPDVGDLNKGQSFDHIEGWDTGDIAEWAVWIPQEGEIEIQTGWTTTSQSGRFAITIGDHTQETTARNKQWHLKISKPGFHLIRVTCLETPTNDSALRYLTVQGSCVREGAVIRKRWRPAAAHTRFSSPELSNGVRIWIMEMDAVPGDLDFYAPITTPFGYYGPSWNADGTVKPGINFSLWSYGRNKPEPPVEQLSHLLAIGNPDATFGGFGHEGTGVKIRNWEPFEGRQNQRQAFALRLEPGEQYNTFYSYFYASDEKRWRLFGVGRKWANGKPIESLTSGSFVEVPGPPQRQRTGSTVRRMRYRGWVSREGRQWERLTIMKMGDIDKQTGLTYTDRGVEADGWFFMETGGWTFRQAPERDIQIPEITQDTPDYLAPTKVQALLQIPSAVSVAAAVRTPDGVELEYSIHNARGNATVTLYHGSSDGLTLPEKWMAKTELPSAAEGSNRVTIRLPRSSKRLRLLLKNSEGQFWSLETTEIR